MKKQTEYEAFSAFASKLLRVPHSEIKAKLDEERKLKAEAKKNIGGNKNNWVV